MKYLIVLGDGMADEPIAALGNKTPLQVAEIPYMDKLAQMGKSGLFDTIPEGFQPGSEIANLTVLGYKCSEVFEGRGSLEAASIGVDILPNEMAMRCNIICIQDGKIKNHSAGHISTEEADVLMKYLDEELGNERLSFHTGTSYRHLLKLKEGDKDLDCTPPHDVVGTPFREVLVRANTPKAQATADYLNDLIIRSQEILENHPINVKRKAEGKDPANSIWPWSAGYKPKMKPMTELYPIKTGSVISAVDLVKGIGVYAGLQNIDVEGATGLYDTNYEGKAQAALDALKQQDFVFLHVEASDEAGHEKDYELKTKTIEYLDKRILKPIMEEVATWNEPVAIALLPDHPTPCAIGTHTRNPVPFVIYKPGETPDAVTAYDEFTVEKGGYGLIKYEEFINEFFR